MTLSALGSMCADRQDRTGPGIPPILKFQIYLKE